MQGSCLVVGGALATILALFPACFLPTQTNNRTTNLLLHPTSQSRLSTSQCGESTIVTP